VEGEGCSCKFPQLDSIHFMNSHVPHMYLIYLPNPLLELFISRLNGKTCEVFSYSQVH